MTELNGTECLCPQSELQLPPVSLGDSLRSPGSSLVLQYVKFGVHFYEWSLYFPPPLGLSTLISIGLPFWGLVFPM